MEEFPVEITIAGTPALSVHQGVLQLSGECSCANLVQIACIIGRFLLLSFELNFEVTNFELIVFEDFLN